MAILSKIREKTLVSILIIGLALFAFVIGDAINKNGSGERVDVVGEINGEEISIENFSERLTVYKSRSGSNASDIQATNVVWDAFVREYIYKEQLEKAGIVVGEEDVWESIISMPYFQNDPSFKNEVGLFDEEMVKEYVYNLREDAIGTASNSAENATWRNWLNNENAIRQNLITNSYNNLVNAGLGTSLEEGKRDYLYNNTNITAKYVYVPYTTVADSLITVTNQEIESYIKENSKKYQVEETRSVKYVKFDVTPSDADKQKVKEELAELVEGFKAAENNVDFFNEVKSDLPINENFIFEDKLPQTIAETVANGNVGDIVGPYEESGFYKLSKIDAFKQMPDSVSASHILISFIGSRSADATITQTEEQAKKTADSILNVVKYNKSKFAALAEEFSIDKTSSVNGGELDWFPYNRMVPEFRDYAFYNKKGDVGIVKTIYGFHIIKINDQKNIQKTTKLVTISRQISASEETDTNFYQDAEIFASSLVDGRNFDELAVEKNYVSFPANGLKILDENVPGLTGNQRTIIRWAFSSESEINDVKRFDVDNGYIVVMLTSETEKGLAPVRDVAARVRPIIIKQKKAALINKKMNAATLEEIATENGVSVKTASKVTMASPTISGIGSEPVVVGAMSTAKEGEVFSNIEGIKGVFAIQVTERELPTELENYDSSRKRLETALKARSSQLYNALKESADIEDNRGYIY